MIRDTLQAGSHVFALDGVRVEFGADGLLDPTAAQLDVLTRTSDRRARFVVVEYPQPGSDAPAPVAIEESVEGAVVIDADIPEAQSEARARRRRGGAE